MDEEVAEGTRDKQSAIERIPRANVGGRDGGWEAGGQTDGEMSRMQ